MYYQSPDQARGGGGRQWWLSPKREGRMGCLPREKGDAGGLYGNSTNLNVSDQSNFNIFKYEISASTNQILAG